MVTWHCAVTPFGFVAVYVKLVSPDGKVLLVLYRSGVIFILSAGWLDWGSPSKAETSAVLAPGERLTDTLLGHVIQGLAKTKKKFQN